MIDAGSAIDRLPLCAVTVLLVRKGASEPTIHAAETP
jgi:hypothetical protein